MPVICVGNLTAGGAGKTPSVLALLQHLQARGVSAHVISRGYGGSLPGPVRVDERRHTAEEVGDEPLLIAPVAPVWTGADRVASAKAAVAAGAEALIMDDGFQNPGLAKDLSVLVVDAASGFGNGRVMPAGPLREPVADGLARAGLLLSIGTEQAQADFAAAWPQTVGIAGTGAELLPLETGMDWPGLRCVAFAGIGRPEKFFATLKGLGAQIVAAHGFGDHEVYSAAVLSRLEAEAKAKDAQLVTTEKDAARLPASFRPKLLVVPVRLRITDTAALDAALAALGL